MSSRIAALDNPSKRIRVLEGERIEAGIDVHKRTYSVTFWSEQRQAIVSSWTQPADPAALITTLAPYRKQIDGIVYEAGPTGYSLVRALRAMDLPADVIAPSRTPKTTGQESKSDRLDSRKLAMWSAKRLLQPVRVPTEEEEGDRQVFRIRDHATRNRRRIKQQIKAFLLQHGIPEPDGLKTWAVRGVEALRKMNLIAQLRFALDMLLADLDHCVAQVRKADRALQALAKTDRHGKAVAALETTPGVGPITAMAIRTELIAPERFEKSRQVTAMMGLAPMVSRTGRTVHEGPLMKCGNARLRTALVEAAWRWVARDPWAKDCFARLVRNTAEKKKAIAAMARRLGIVLWRISVTGEPYRPKPYEKPDKQSKHRKSQPGLPDKKTRKTKAKRAPSTARQRPLSVQPPR